MARTVAALFVIEGGPYYGLRGVDPWPESRDARTYPGPHPVVAHPPCARWAMPLAKVNQTRYGHRIGDDGGCFEAALTAVRKWGGVLEHPAYTAAWACFDLPKPRRGAGWTEGAGGWTCQVAQSAYGHRARKRTWLYCVGEKPKALRWDEPAPTALTSWLQKTNSTLPRLSKREALETPIEFCRALVRLARSS